MLGVALRRMTIGRDTRCLVVEAGDPAWVDGFHGFEPMRACAGKIRTGLSTPIVNPASGDRAEVETAPPTPAQKFLRALAWRVDGRGLMH
jgi:hypothetical protein